MCKLRFQVRLKPFLCRGHDFNGHTKSCLRCCPLPLPEDTALLAGLARPEVVSRFIEAARE